MEQSKKIHKQIKEQYIDEQTIAIESFFMNGWKSKITKLNGIFYADQTPYALLDEACLEYASTLEGRMKAITRSYNYYKPPVIVKPCEIGFFPTTSPNHDHCVWISQLPFTVCEGENNCCILQYQNNIELPVKFSRHIIMMQHYRLHRVLNYYRLKTLS